MRFFGFKIKFLLWFSKNPYYHRSIRRVFFAQDTNFDICPPEKTTIEIKKIISNRLNHRSPTWRNSCTLSHVAGGTIIRGFYHSPSWAGEGSRDGCENGGGRPLHLRNVHEPAIKPDRRWKGISWNNEIAFLSRGHERNSIYTMIFLFLGNRDKPIPD